MLSDVINVLDKDTFQRFVYAGNAVETVQLIGSPKVCFPLGVTDRWWRFALLPTTVPPSSPALPLRSILFLLGVWRGYQRRLQSILATRKWWKNRGSSLAGGALRSLSCADPACRPRRVLSWEGEEWGGRSSSRRSSIWRTRSAARVDAADEGHV